MREIVFDVDPDAPPFARGVGTIVKRAAAHPRVAKRLARMKGVLGLQSSSDSQKATVRFDRGRIRLNGGLSDEAGVVITLDPNDSDAKPKIKGAARHPVFAMGLAKVLEPPTGTWQEEAAKFWAFAGSAPHMPAALRVVCTDDGTEAVFGNGGSEYEIQGSAKALASVFTGASIIGEDMFSGKIFVVGTIEHASVLTGRSIAWAMGEGR